MWEQFAARFASSAGQGLGEALGGGGGPITSGVNARDQAWAVGGGDWTVNLAPGAGKGVMTGAAAGLPTWLLIAGAVGALWLLGKR